MGNVLIKHNGLRRALGAVLMWLAPEAWSGVALLATGAALEIAGITLEHRNGRSQENRHAVER